MSNVKIYLNAPEAGERELDQLSSVIKSGWISTQGKALEEFERSLEQLVSSKRVLALNSGTSALHLALKLSGVRPGDRVGVSSLTFCASANVVLYEGGVPVFFDSEDKGWNLDPQLLESYLNSNKLHALIVTHLYGMPAQLDQIRQICKRWGVILIEDAAEALGASVSGTLVGSIGDYGVFSFNGNKIITTSGGGALIADPVSYEKGLKWATQSKEPDSLAYHHEEIGYNYRLSNVLAGLGLAQMSRLEDHLIRKQRVFEYYQEHLPADCFQFQEVWADSISSNRWLNGLVIKESVRRELTPTEIIAHLEKANIESRHFWKPMHMQPLYENHDRIGGDVCEVLFENGFCLPSGVGLSEADLERIVSSILDLLVSRGLS